MASPEHLFERDIELYLKYHEIRKENPRLSNEEVIRIVLRSPTSRFWVSLYQVYREILNLVKGRPLSRHMRSIRRKQIEDIYVIYKELADKPMFKGCSVFFIVQFAIACRAPQFYLSYSRALAIISRMKREYIIEEVTD